MDTELGKSYTFTKSFGEEEVNLFAELSEDLNPIHVDDAYAASSPFGQKIVHGILLISMFSKLFGTLYPGPGSIYRSQNTKFKKPVFMDQEVEAKATLKEYNEKTRLGIFDTKCLVDGKVVVMGEAEIIFPEFT